jgi:hypothetical protein
MIGKQTTLILGAGASAPFEFPTGYELLRRVMEWANINIGRTNPDLFSGFNKTEIDEFREALRRSGKTSVDSFLEHRPEFIPVGKLAMAMTLIQCEHEPHLFKRDGKSWYEYLSNQLNAPFEDFGQNRLRILTFNYDRSLEHFLFTALKNSSGKSEDECAGKLNTIPIIHLHGDLGALPHTGKALARPYNTNITLEALNIAIKRIKIIHEGITKEPQFELAHKFLSESEVICFLGFGYHPLNMERLGIKSGLSGGLNGKQIIGSSFGLTNAESNQISGRYGFQLRPGRFEYQNRDVLQFLRESGVLHNG